MSIWIYKDKEEKPDESIVKSEKCIFCNESMEQIYREAPDIYSQKILSICPVCGWWTIWKQRANPYKFFFDEGATFDLYGTSAILKKLDLTDLNQPIEEIEQYLLTQYEKRKGMHPKLFEDVVASVFRNLGYESIVTSYHNDGGIDVVLRENDTEIGVQVKRYNNSIKVSQIREFAGALMERGMTRGIFVTTSSYQKGAYTSVDKISRRGMKVELYDCMRFYDALKLSLKDKYKNHEEFIEQIGVIKTPVIYENEDAWF